MNEHHSAVITTCGNRITDQGHISDNLGAEYLLLIEPLNPIEKMAIHSVFLTGKVWGLPNP